MNNPERLEVVENARGELHDQSCMGYWLVHSLRLDTNILVPSSLLASSHAGLLS